MSTRVRPLASIDGVQDGDLFHGFPVSLGDDEKREEDFVTPLDWNWQEHDDVANSDHEPGDPRIPSPDTQGDESSSNRCWYSPHCMSEVYATTLVTSIDDARAL